MSWATAIALDPGDTVAVNQKPFPLGVHILARQSGHLRKSIIMAKNDKGYEDKTMTRGRCVILVKGEGLSEELTFDNMRELM